MNILQSNKVGIVICKGREGFSAEYPIFKKTGDGYPVCHAFYVHQSDQKCDEDFELVFEEQLDGSLWLKFMGHRNAESLRQSGVPEASIFFVCEYMKKKIVSTVTSSACGNYWRTPEATKVWERLKSQGKAEYRVDIDIYETLVPASAHMW